MCNFSPKHLWRVVLTRWAQLEARGRRGQCLIAVNRKMEGYGEEAWKQPDGEKERGDPEEDKEM